MPAAVAAPLIGGGLGAAGSIINGGKQSSAQQQQNNVANQQLQLGQSLVNQFLGTVAPTINNILNGAFNNQGVIGSLFNLANNELGSGVSGAYDVMNYNDTNALQQAGEGNVNTLVSRLGGVANPALLAQQLQNTNSQQAMQTNASERLNALQQGETDLMNAQTNAANIYGNADQLIASLLGIEAAPVSSGLSSINAAGQSYGNQAASYGNPWGSLADNLGTIANGVSTGKAGSGAKPVQSAQSAPSTTPQSVSQQSISTPNVVSLPGINALSGTPWGGLQQQQTA